MIYIVLGPALYRGMLLHRAGIEGEHCCPCCITQTCNWAAYVMQLMRLEDEMIYNNVQVEELLGRLRGVLPSAPWLGGVLQPAAWGPGASLRGALFLNSQTHDEGAVGCIMQGPLRFDQLCWQVGFYRCSPAVTLACLKPLTDTLRPSLRHGDP